MLWELAEAVAGAASNDLDAALFERCLSIKQIGLPKLTMGMFWMRRTDIWPWTTSIEPISRTSMDSRPRT